MLNDGDDGGNGGPGGDVHLVYGASSRVLGLLMDILDHLEDDSKKWPADFKVDAQTFIKVLLSNEAAGITTPYTIKSVDDVLKLDAVCMRKLVVYIYQRLSGPDEELDSALTHSINVSGGERGYGYKGSKKECTNGKLGQPGQWFVQRAARESGILNSEVCYVHPVQSQMLLDKANLLYFGGSDKEIKQATSILERLQYRLEPFMKPPSGDEPPLWKAYRQAEGRLCIAKGPKDQEPASIRRLRAVGKNTTATLKRLSAGVDFYGKKPSEAPRGSFLFYKGMVNSLLGHLQTLEETYSQYASGDKTAARNLADIGHRKNLCRSSIERQIDLVNTAVDEIGNIAKAIEVSASIVMSARDSLVRSMKNLPAVLLTKSGLQFGDFVNAISQTLFTHGAMMPLMAGVQLGGLIHQSIEDVVRDDGAPVRKEYVLKKLRSVTGSVESVSEGYQVLKNGGIQLDDPGNEKLLITKERWDAIREEVSEALKSKDFGNAISRFDAYIGM